MPSSTLESTLCNEITTLANGTSARHPLKPCASLFESIKGEPIRFAFLLVFSKRAFLGCKPPYFGFTTFSLLESKVESNGWLARMRLRSWLKTRTGEPDLMNRSTFVGSALSVLLVFSVISYSKTFIHSQEPKLAQTTLPSVLEVAGQIPDTKATTAADVSTETGSVALKDDGSASTASGSNAGASTDFVVAAQTYVATAYSLRGRTASGRSVTRGLIAADPSVLPLGSRVLVEAGSWSGEYLVADTGGAVKGRRIDIWTPTSREAMQFGRRPVKLTVLEFGGKRARPALGRPRLVNPPPASVPVFQQPL